MSPQHYVLRPSRALRWLIWLLHVFALAVCVPMSWVSAYGVLLALLLPVSLGWQLRRVALCQLYVHQSGLECWDSRDRHYQARLLASTWIGVDVVFLHIQDLVSQKKIIHLIAFDALSSNDFRRLRVALRWLR